MGRWTPDHASLPWHASSCLPMHVHAQLGSVLPCLRPQCPASDPMILPDLKPLPLMKGLQ